MEIILDLIKFESLIPIWWLLFSWLIWLLLKWRNWPRPGVSVMLIYSASMGVFFIKSWQLLNSCRKDPLCDPDFSFSLFPFLAEVSFWLIVLYVPIALELKPRIIFNQRRNWWIALLVLTLAGWHIISEDFVAIVRGFIYLDVITTDIFFYTLIGIFAPWFIWLLLGRIERPRPSLPTMLIYSISVTNASTRLWIEVSACKLAMNLCEVNFSLPLFLGKIALWFVPLYTLMKLISRVEFGKKLVELEEKHKDRPIGSEP